MDTQLTIIDHETDLVTEEEVSQASQQFISLLSEMGVTGPLLLQDQALLKLPIEQQSLVLDLYDQEPLQFGDVTNQSLLVYGAALFEHEGGMKKGGEVYPRYFQGRILVKLDGTFRIVKTSGKILLRKIAFLCRDNGWYIFKEPIEYKFIHRGTGQPHIMDRVEKPEIKEGVVHA